MIKKIKNVLWDLDGTLTDPAEGMIDSIQYALEKMGCPRPKPKDLIQHIGPPLQIAFATLLGPGNNDRISTAIEHYRRHGYGKKKICIIKNKLYPNIPKVLKKLQESGKKLFIATSKPTVLSKQVMAHFKLDPYFAAIYGSELDGTRSNKGDLISHILAQEKLDPARTVMIGDRKHDILGALKNGVKGIGACWGYGSEEELKSAGSVFLVHKPTDLIPMLATRDLPK